MKKFKFSYDKENDDLFIYLPKSKSAGAVELGNFIFDFDKDGNLVAIQIIEASKVLSKLVSEIKELTKIKSIKADIVNFRNMAFVRVKISTNNFEEKVTISIPFLKEKSPALKY